MRRIVVLAALLLSSAPAFAQDTNLDEPKKKGPPPVPRYSTELIDPGGSSRLQVVGRMMFSDGDSVFGGVAVQSYEIRLGIGITDGLALNANVPVGLLSPPGDGDSESFVGNFSLGGSYGFGVLEQPGMNLDLAGALDVMFPTSPRPDSANLILAQIMVASIRAYEPQLYLPQLLSFRFRTQAELDIDALALTVELALSPGVTTGEESDFIMLFGVTGRASYLIGRTVEPYLEMGAALDVAGPAPIRPPMLITPGVRFHIGEIFDPSIFMSFNFVQAPQILFGFDLAGALRPSDGKKDRDGPVLSDDPLDRGF